MNERSNNTEAKPIVRSGLRRPEWICRNARQNAILVRDKSGSMSGQKADDASAASLDLVSELAQPVNKDGFGVAVVDFADSSGIVHGLEKATKLDGKVTPLSAGSVGGTTNITAGLGDALKVLEGAEAGSHSEVVYLRPVVICFTDGCHNTGPEPGDVANRIKLVADLVTVAFGRDADESLMRDLASSPQHFYRCSTGRELRSFLAAVGATMTATMAAGTNATQALSTLQQ